MVRKEYTWADGAELDEHSHIKLRIIREYFREYLLIKCKNPMQRKFRLAVVDGFAGGGRYKCGTPGSPLIFLETLKETLEEINLTRASHDIRNSLEIECYLILNDANPDAYETLKQHCEPIIAEIRETPGLHLEIEYKNSEFEIDYANVKKSILERRHQSVLFNLDQYGHNAIALDTVKDILSTFKSSEVFLTFAIQTLLTYLSRANPNSLSTPKKIGIEEELERLKGEYISKKEYLGATERLIFDTLKGSCPFFSPFSIHNPDGWRYWLIHFANHVRARQAYNDVLHRNSNSQAHFGRAGINMLSYDPSRTDGSLYLFAESDRVKALDQLREDIPRFISSSGDAMRVGDFYENVYNETAAHSDDVNSAIITNPELETHTSDGGVRRRASQIKPDDIITLKRQLILPLHVDKSS